MVEQTDIVEQVKEKNRIEDVVEADGFPLQKQSRYRKCTSKENGSSLVVDVQNQAYFWNSHAEHGDVINWVMRRRNMDFKAAMDWLCDRASIQRPNWGNHDPAARMAARMREDCLDVAQRVFIRWFSKSTEAQAYAQRRGWTIWQGEDASGAKIAGTVVKAMLGYSGAGTPAEYAEMRAELQAAGVDLESPAAVAILGYKGDLTTWAKRHDVQSLSDDWVARGYIPGMIGHKRLVYPHVRSGRIVYLSGRSIDVKYHFNLPVPLVGDKQPFYNQVYGLTAEQAVIVEGQADAVSLGQWGIGAVALAGVTPSDWLIELLKRHQALYVGLDADQAGNNNRWKIADAFGPMVRLVDWSRPKFRLLAKVDGDTRAVRSPDELVQAIMSGQARGDERPATITNMLEAAPRVKDERGFEQPGYQNADGHLVQIHTATDLWQAIGQIFQVEAEAKAARVSMLRELLDWSPAFVDTDGRVTLVKDANDLLKAMVQAEVADDMQRKRVGELISAAPTFVENICEWAGAQTGADRDKALPQALSVVARMPELQLSQYRKALAKALRVGIRELDIMLKTLAAVQEREKSDGEPVYTWGGPIGGFLVDYLYDVEQDHASLAWRDPQGRVSSGDDLVIDGKRYLPYPTNETLRSGAIVFPNQMGEKKSIRDLVAYIEQYLKSIYLMPSDQAARLIAYWVLSTWVYDAFETVIYLRAMGGAGSGKSELVKRIGLVCYRTMTANGAGSTSSLFRAVERYKCTTLLDEADLAQSDTEQDMVKFYNLGAMRGNPIWRTVEVVGPNGDKDWEERAFQTFCPKLIAMRKEFRDDAVGTRSLTLKLQPREMTELKAANIPLTINASIRARAQAIRNLLLRWRLETWQPEIEVDMEYYDLSISARLNQVAGPLLAIARDDPEQQEDIRRTLREYYADSIINQSMTLSARVIEALWKIWNYEDLHKEMVKLKEDGENYIKVGDITKITNAIINEMNDEEDDDEEDSKFRKSRELKPQRVGRILRDDLAFQMTPRTRDGFFVIWNEPRLLGLSTKYGVNPEDFGPKKAAQSPASQPKPEPQQGKLA